MSTPADETVPGKLLKAMPEANMLAGQNLGKYNLVKYIGQTNTAHVYRVVQQGGDEWLSLYLFPNQYVDSPQFVEKFMLQAGIVAELHNANIVPVLNFGIENNYPYIVSKHISGPSLDDLLTASRRRMVRIPLSAGIYIINTIGEALGYAHELGITHGDIRPTNILLANNGSAMLTDFAFYSFFKDFISSRRKKSSPLSTEDYSVLQKQIKFDIFSMGALLYQIMTGHFPYEEAEVNVHWLFKNHKDVTLTAAKQHVPELPKEIGNAIACALYQSTIKQYLNVEEFLRDVSTYAQQVKTSILPQAHISGMMDFSSRFTRAGVPEEIEEKQWSVAIYFMDTGQVIELDNGRQYSLGRIYQNSPVEPDINLAPFKGYEWGISRLHAMLDIDHDNVTLTDNNSSNGTFHSGQKLTPHSPYALHHGDIFMLGKLRLQILISKEESA